MELLMDDDSEVNRDFRFGFSFNSNFTDNAGGLQQQPPYRSTAASSSGEDLSTYNYGGLGSETHSSSEGEKGDSSSIYGMPEHEGHWNNINDSSYYFDEIDIVDENPDMILPMPRIPTSSPLFTLKSIQKLTTRT